MLKYYVFPKLKNNIRTFLKIILHKQYKYLKINELATKISMRNNKTKYCSYVID